MPWCSGSSAPIREMITPNDSQCRHSRLHPSGIEASFCSPCVTAAGLTPSPRASADRLEYSPSSSILCHPSQRSRPLGRVFVLFEARFGGRAAGTSTTNTRVLPTVSSGSLPDCTGRRKAPFFVQSGSDPNGIWGWATHPGRPPSGKTLSRFATLRLMTSGWLRSATPRLANGQIPLAPPSAEYLEKRGRGEEEGAHQPDHDPPPNALVPELQLGNVFWAAPAAFPLHMPPATARSPERPGLVVLRE